MPHPTRNPNPGRFAHLDGLRGLAALSVVFLHFMALAHPGAVFGPGVKSETSGLFEQWFAETPLHLLISGHGAVHLFFILSGFVLSWGFLAGPGPAAPKDLVIAMVKRPIRLIFPVLAVQILAVILLHAGCFFHGEASAVLGNSWLAEEWKPAPNWATFFHSLVTEPFTGGQRWVPPLWTIAVELYGSWMVFAVLLAGRTPWLRRLLMLICMIAVLKVPNALSLEAYQWANLQDFILGMAAADLWRNSERSRNVLDKRWVRRVLLIIGLFCISYPQYISEPLLSPWYSWMPPLPLLAGDYGTLGALCLMAALLPGHGRANSLLLSVPVQFLGRISYSLYAVHFLVLVTLCSWVFATTGAWPTALRDAAALLVMLGGSLALAALMTRFLDVPGQKLANRFGKWLRTKWL